MKTIFFGRLSFRRQIMSLLTGVFLMLMVVLVSSNANALTLVPPLLEFGLDPGGELTSKVRVINETAETTTLYTSTANFTARDESGNPFFLFDEEGGLADWIAITPGPLVLLPGERLDIPFTLKVPNDAEPGGYYAGIFLGSAPPDADPGEVTVVAKLGTLMLLRVSGDVTLTSAIQEFHIKNDQRVFNRLPVELWYRLRNTGNLHIRPTGSAVVRNTIGLTSARVNANPVEGAVLPESVRRFETSWQRREPQNVEYRNAVQSFFGEAWQEARNFGFGRYTVRLEFDNVADTTSPTISFWVFPWRFLLTIIVAIFLVWWIMRRGIKRYNRWIIKKARLT